MNTITVITIISSSIALMCWCYILIRFSLKLIFVNVLIQVFIMFFSFGILWLIAYLKGFNVLEMDFKVESEYPLFYLSLFLTVLAFGLYGRLKAD